MPVEPMLTVPVYLSFQELINLQQCLVARQNQLETRLSTLADSPVKDFVQGQLDTTKTILAKIEQADNTKIEQILKVAEQQAEKANAPAEQEQATWNLVSLTFFKAHCGACHQEITEEAQNTEEAIKAMGKHGWNLGQRGPLCRYCDETDEEMEALKPR